MVHVDLFSGIGGFSLACEWAEIETICFVENDKYCQKVLRKHWPGVPIVGDIRDVEKIKEIVANATRGRFQQCEVRGEKANDSCQVDKNTRGGAIRANSPTILATAGFPCQPFSVAGKREGERDDRYLWPETLAVIEAVKPEWVLLENVTGIINLALDTVLSDLEGAGYSYETLIIPACAVNAPHRRDRVWIVANSRCGQQGERGNTNEVSNGRHGETRPTSEIGRSSDIIPDTTGEGLSNSNRERDRTARPRYAESKCGSEDVANSNQQGLEGGKEAGDIESEGAEREEQPTRFSRIPEWWAVEPELGRVAHGIPNRVDRLKCLGNAIVPQVAYEIIKVIYENQTS